MNNGSRVSYLAALALLAAAPLPAQESLGADSGRPGLEAAPDATGIVATLDVNGPVNERSAFFRSLGTNGRTCATCHVAAQAMSISAADVRTRFLATHGRDPLFAAIDGANCPDARPGNAADHSLLLSHGLIRIFLPLPVNAQFSISVVRDPYGCAMAAAAGGGQPLVSVYRRPLPTANLNFLSTLMFDGRETKSPLNVLASFPANLAADLTQQAIDAVAIHAQGTQAPSAAQLEDIVAFERGLYSEQAYDSAAGLLSAAGAYGGPGYAASALAASYHPGINDSLGADPAGTAFNAQAMTLYLAWSGANDRSGDFRAAERAAARRRIAAGEALFNSTPVQISNVRGLNDNAALGAPVTFTGTCTTCHDTPNTGNHSFPLPLDIGTSHAGLPGAESDPDIAAGLAQLSLPEVPVYLISGCPNPFGGDQPESFYTTDPGKALVTGLCSDFNRGKGPILRGLAARAPYFHNGAAADLNELVNFYNLRFRMGLTPQQKQDLIAFLNSL